MSLWIFSSEPSCSFLFFFFFVAVVVVVCLFSFLFLFLFGLFCFVCLLLLLLVASWRFFFLTTTTNWHLHSSDLSFFSFFFYADVCCLLHHGEVPFSSLFEGPACVIFWHTRVETFISLQLSVCFVSSLFLHHGESYRFSAHTDLPFFGTAGFQRYKCK